MRLLKVFMVGLLVITGLQFTSGAASATTTCTQLKDKLVAEALSSGNVGAAAQFKGMCPATCPELHAIYLSLIGSRFEYTASDAYQTCLTQSSGSSGNGSGNPAPTPPKPCKKKIAFSALGTPRIYGNLRAGNEVFVDEGSWKPLPSKVSYQWLRDGKAIRGATRSTYMLTTSDINHKVSARVTASESCRLVGTKTSLVSKTIQKSLSLSWKTSPALSVTKSAACATASIFDFYASKTSETLRKGKITNIRWTLDGQTLATKVPNRVCVDELVHAGVLNVTADLDVPDMKRISIASVEPIVLVKQPVFVKSGNLISLSPETLDWIGSAEISLKWAEVRNSTEAPFFGNSTSVTTKSGRAGYSYYGRLQIKFGSASSDWTNDLEAEKAGLQPVTF